MSLDKKLTEWYAQHLIDNATLASLRAYEAAKPNHKDTAWRYGLIALAVLCVVLGALFIIASNWASIPFSIKLSVTAALNIALGGWIVHRFAHKNVTTRHHYSIEIPLIFLVAGQLGLMALIGQYLQSSAPFETVVLYWFILTMPMLFIAGRDQASAYLLLCIAALVTAYSFELSADVIYAVYVIGSTLCVLYGQSAIGNVLRPAWASAFTAVGTIVISLCLFFYHFNHHTADQNPYMFYVLEGCGLSALYLAHAHYTSKTNRTFPAWFVFYSTLSIVLLHEALPSSHPIGMTMIFCLYFIGLGWLARRHNKTMIAILSVLAIGGRLVVYFISAQNHMFFSGIGLMIVGLATIAAIRVLSRKKQQETTA